SPEEGIQREINEELGMAILVEDPAGIVAHKYPDVEILLIAYNCRSEDRVDKSHDHDDVQWVSAENLKDYIFSEADKKLIALLNRKTI
ncbi:MAG: NUDIX domain-containing protein, partial [Calditrichota bacterium]